MNIREQLLNAKNKRVRDRRLTVNVDKDTEVEVLLKCPTVGQRNKWRESLDGKHGEMLLQVVIDCAYDALTNKPLFDNADRELLLEQPANSWVDTLATTVIELMNAVEDTAKKG